MRYCLQQGVMASVMAVAITPFEANRGENVDRKALSWQTLKLAGMKI